MKLKNALLAILTLAKPIMTFRMAGFSLLEVLISLLLLSLILLSFEATEIFSLQELEAVSYFNTAVNQLNAMRERLHALNENAGLEEQIAIWNQQNQETLPQGVGEVKGTFPTYTVTLYWGKTRHTCQKIHLGKSGCIKEIITL